MAGRSESIDSRTLAKIGTREDYAALATMSDAFGVDFDVLAKRLEDGGKSVEDIRRGLARARRKPDEWVQIDEAARMVPGLKEVSHLIRTAPRRKLNSRLGATSPRGCGWLWYVPDLADLMKIKRECAVSLTAAIRIQEAKHRGAL